MFERKLVPQDVVVQGVCPPAADTFCLDPKDKCHTFLDLKNEHIIINQRQTPKPVYSEQVWPPPPLLFTCCQQAHKHCDESHVDMTL